MSGVRGAVLNGVCANSCHVQDSACAAVWAAANANASLANCEAACRQCAQCRFASFSLVEGVCVWQERCKLLQLPGEDFRTLKLKRQRDRRQERALASAATTPGCQAALAHCRVETRQPGLIYRLGFGLAAWASRLTPVRPPTGATSVRSGTGRPPASASLGRHADMGPTRQI